jgi:hypothetical protein
LPTVSATASLVVATTIVADAVYSVRRRGRPRFSASGSISAATAA